MVFFGSAGGGSGVDFGLGGWKGCRKGVGLGYWAKICVGIARKK